MKENIADRRLRLMMLGIDYLEIPNLVRASSRNKHCFSKSLLECPWFNTFKGETIVLIIMHGYHKSKFAFFFSHPYQILPLASFCAPKLNKKIGHELGGQPEKTILEPAHETWLIKNLSCYKLPAQ